MSVLGVGGERETGNDVRTGNGNKLKNIKITKIYIRILNNNLKFTPKKNEK